MPKDNKLVLEISLGTIVRVIGVLVTIWLLFILRDIVLIILMSVVIASAVEPATQWFRKYQVSRLPAVLFVYVFSFAVFLALLYFFIPPLSAEFSGLAATLPDRLKTIDLLPSISTTALTKSFSVADVLTQLQDSFGAVSGNVLHTASTIFGGVLSFFLIVVLSFYLAVQERGVENFLRIITPINREKYVLNLWKRAQQKIGLWIQGQLLLGLLVGILVFLGLLIFQIKYAFILAILAAVFELIPVFGPILSAVPAIVFGFSESVSLGLTITAFYIIIQQFENHLFYPLVVKKIIGIPSIAVVIALLVGAKLAGFLGIILSVPAATLLMEITNDLERQKLAAENAG